MVAAPENSGASYQIDDLTLNSGSRSVTRGGEELKISGLTFDLLLALAETAPSMASYDQLADLVWKGRAVSPGTIAQRAKLLRAAISDDAASPRYFELVRGQGYRMVADVRTVSTRPTGRRSRPWTALAAVAVVIVAAISLAYVGSQSGRVESSVAVLPFKDLSESGDQQYLADGLAEELINQLAALDRLEVASRSESFAFRGPEIDLQDVGTRLKVATVVEGSVRKSGDLIRVTVQLVRSDNGFHLWSQSFDSDTRDIFNTQEDIARSVAGALGVKLGVGGANEFYGAGTRNFEAYEAYLQRNFEKAIELDPKYAAAWARQGMTIAATIWGNMPEQAPRIIEQAYPYALRAIQLDPDSAMVQADFAELSYARLDWDSAEQSFARALDIERNADRLTHYGNMMMRTGRARRAVAVYLESDAVRRRPWPKRSAAPLYRSNAHIALQQIEAAHRQTTFMHEEVALFNRLTIALNFGTAQDVRTAIEALPKGTPDYSFLYAPLVDLLDAPEESIEFLLDLADDPTREWPYKYETIALLLAYLGRPQESFDVFMNELQYTSIRFGSLWFPVMTDVRRLPDFKQFLIDVNLVDYWRQYRWSDFCRPIDKVDFICD